MVAAPLGDKHGSKETILQSPCNAPAGKSTNTSVKPAASESAPPPVDCCCAASFAAAIGPAEPRAGLPTARTCAPGAPGRTTAPPFGAGALPNVSPSILPHARGSPPAACPATPSGRIGSECSTSAPPKPVGPIRSTGIPFCCRDPLRVALASFSLRSASTLHRAAVARGL